MSKATVGLLNELLEEERALLRSVDALVPRVQDPELRVALGRILKEVENNCAELAWRIKRLGGEPSEKTGDLQEMAKTSSEGG